MNGWFDSAHYAARDRMQRLERQARAVRAARLGAEAAPTGAIRRGAASILRRLADALEPQPGRRSPVGS